MKTFSNKFRLIADEPVEDGLTLWKLFEQTKTCHDELRVVVNNFGSRLKLKVQKKKNQILLASRGEHAKLRLTLKDFREILSEKSLDHKIFFKTELIMSLTIEENMIRLDTTE